MSDLDMLIEATDIIRTLTDRCEDEAIKDLYEVTTMLLSYIRERVEEDFHERTR